MGLIDKQILSVMIYIKRTEMVEKAKNRGLTHPEVVACSQELDILLNRYQKIA
ncbi:aspartyl-phosphate phosphatase Spo0E family protein [Sporosarcina sp. FSL W8-0480]|uniref:aspartyl-phosphate phosphatase Spo0E family protein n=1 Tax=Sporosarcina sp. FSL W8-0480 TaxID=2954701 RepID=UPI0030DBAFC8